MKHWILFGLLVLGNILSGCILETQIAQKMAVRKGTTGVA